MVPTSRVPPPPLRMLLPLLLVLMTSLISANPTPPTASSAQLAAEHRETDDQRDGRVWDMLRQESRSFISAILPDKMAARTHDVLWSAPLHERAAREDRIPRYTVVAMAGPPMMQSHDTELLDAALSPAVAGDFGRKANGLAGEGRFPEVVGVDDAGRHRPEMMHESELMPNSLTTDEGHGGEDADGAQVMAGGFGQRGSSRPAVSDGEETAPSMEQVGRAPASAAPTGDIVSGFSSFPQTERVPYVQDVRDFEAEMKQESEQTSQPTSPPTTDDFTPPTFEEFPFDSLKMDSSTGGGPQQAQFIEQGTGDENSNEQLSFDTSNFPNFPKFAFPRESGQDTIDHPDDVSAFGHGDSDWFKQGQTGSKGIAEPEATRFPMFPGEQEPANSENMDSDMKNTKKSMESMESDDQKIMLENIMNEQPETTASHMMEEVKFGNMSPDTEDPSIPAITSDGKITSHAGGLPLAPVTEDRNTKTPPAVPANNQFENFKEGGAYPDLNLIGFPSFPDIPGNSESHFPAGSPDTNEETPLSVEESDTNITMPKESSPAAPPSFSEPHLDEFVHPDIFPEADFSPTAGDEFYARLESDPTFQTPTAPDLSFSADTRTPLEFPELRGQFPLIDTDFSHAGPKFPELKTHFPQPEVDFSHTEPEFPELPSLRSENDEAFESFAEVADLNRDPADDVQVFSDEEKMNDRRAINYHSPAQFGGRHPTTYNHFSKSSGGDEFQNTFFKNDFNRVTTQRPTPTTSQVPKLKRPEDLQHPHNPRYPQGPSRPYPYKPRDPVYEQHTTTTTYRPAIFVNEGPKVNGEEEDTPLTPSTSKPSVQELFPDRNNIPGYIPRPTRPRPHHKQPAGVYGQHSTPAMEPEPQPESQPEPEANPEEIRRIPGYIPRPSRPAPPHRAPQGVFDRHVRPTQASLPYQQPTPDVLPTAYTPERLVSSTAKGEQTPTYLPVDVSDMSSEDQPPTYVPGDFSTTTSDTATPTAATTLETEPPTFADITNPTTMAESSSSAASTPPPTTQPPVKQAATRKPYTFPPFRRRTTPASVIGIEDATTGQFAPEFGTRITRRKPAGSGSDDSVRRRRPGGHRRPAGGAGSGRGSRRRPGMRRRPLGGRRGTTPEPYTTTAAPIETTTVLPTVETTNEFVDLEVEQKMTDVSDSDQQEGITRGFLKEQDLPEDATEGSEVVPDTAQPIETREPVPTAQEMVDDFGDQGMLIDVLPREEIPIVPVLEETSAVGAPVDGIMEPEVLSEEVQGQISSQGTVPEQEQPVEITQEELVPVEMTQEEMMGPVDIISGEIGDAEVIPEENSVAEPNPEEQSPVHVMPVLSEVSQSTAEPMPEGESIVPAPAIDISENTDIHVPPSSGVSREDTPVIPEFPGGIFHLQPARPQMQTGEDVIIMEESGEVAPGPVIGSFPLGEAVDVRDVNDLSDAPVAVQGNDILEEESMGPTAVSESREFAVEENGLEGFSTFPEADAGDLVDVSAVLQEELGDDSAGEIQTVEAGFPETNAGLGDNFFTDETLQTLDNVPTHSNPGNDFGPSSDPSEISEEIPIPSFPHQQQVSSILTSEDREQGHEMADATPPPTAPETEMSNTHRQVFEMSEAAPPHMMNGTPMEENNDQYPKVYGGPPAMRLSDVPVLNDSSDMPVMLGDMPQMPGDMHEMPSEMHEMSSAMPQVPSEMPEMPIDMPVIPSEMPEMPNVMPQMSSEMPEMPSVMPGMPSEMPDTPSDMPEMPSEMPEMQREMPEILNNMPPHMTIPGLSMQESGNSGSPMIGDAVPLIETTPETKDIMATHSMMPEVSEGEQQLITPSDAMPQQELMPGMPLSEGDMPIPHEYMPTSQDVLQQEMMPSPQDTMVEPQGDETVGQSEESPISFDMTMPSGFQTFNAPSEIPAFVEPEIETAEAIPEGFGPPITYSVIPEGGEPAPNTDIAPGMTNSVDDGFFGTVDVPEETPVIVEDLAAMAGEDTMTISESDDSVPTTGFDIRSSFGDGIAESSDEGELREDIIPDREAMDSLPETNMLPDMLAQPTSETLIVDGGFSEILSEGPLNTLDDSETANSFKSQEVISQGYYPPQEDQQIIQGDLAMGSIEDEAVPLPEQSPIIVEDSNMSDEQFIGVDVGIVAEPESEVEETTLPSEILSGTESDVEVVDVVPEQYVAPAEEPDVHDEASLQDISTEEGQEQELQGSSEGLQEQQQEEEGEEQESQREEQELQVLENQEENQEIQEDQEEHQVPDQNQELPTGYGPPHSDTIVTDDVTSDADVTEEGGVTAPVPEGDIPMTYDVPITAPEQPAL